MCLDLVFYKKEILSYKLLQKNRKSCLIGSLFTQTMKYLNLKDFFSISEWVEVSYKDFSKVSSKRLQIQQMQFSLQFWKVSGKNKDPQVLEINYEIPCMSTTIIMTILTKYQWIMMKENTKFHLVFR